MLFDKETLAQLDQDFERASLFLERQRMKSSLAAFVKAAWPILEPTTPYVESWHLLELCAILQNPRYRRVIINVPPGTMKSLLVSVFWPAWEWARNPRLRFLTCAYGAHLTVRDNLRVRDLLASPWYQRLFPISLVEDQNTKTRFNTEEGGWRIASSVGGAAIGEHPDIIIIDDALTPTQAESEPERTAVNNWFDRTISTRGVTRGVRIFVVGQRLHEQDLPGYLLTRGNWELVCFPMRYECTQPPFVADPRDHRTQAGELLIPSLFPEEVVRQMELDLGPYGTAGQLQQRPAPEGGGLFKSDWFRILDVPPALMRVVRGWDTAATEGGGDWTAGVKIGEEFSPETFQSTGRFVILDVQRHQLGPAGVEGLIRLMAEMDGVDCAQREEREGGSAGKMVVDARAKSLVGYDYAGVPVSGSKITRSKPFRAQCEAGNVWLLRAEWNAAYLSELSRFPSGTYDDQVDASSSAFNAVLLEPAPEKERATW